MNDQEKHFLLSGLYYGYPLCCITAFVEDARKLNSGERTLTEHRTLRTGRPLHNTGYIPCAACAASYPEETLVACINRVREAPQPFPDGGTDEDYGKWVQQTFQLSRTP